MKHNEDSTDCLGERLAESFENAGAVRSSAFDESCRQLARDVLSAATVQYFLGLFAAPRLLARVDWTALPKEALLEPFDEYLAMTRKSKSSAADRPPPRPEDEAFLRTIHAARGRDQELVQTLRAMLEAWEPSNTAPEPLVRAARQWMAENGARKTDTEWDQYDVTEEELEKGTLPYLRATPR